MKHERLTELLMNTVATHKASLLMCNHASVMLAIRSLLVVQHRRFANISTKRVEDGGEVSVELKQTSVNYIQKF
jgi:hypothetical protein